MKSKENKKKQVNVFDLSEVAKHTKWLPESPIQEGEDELWQEVGRIIMNGYEFSNEVAITKLLKSKFQLTAKPQTNDTGRYTKID